MLCLRRASQAQFIGICRERISFKLTLNRPQHPSPSTSQRQDFFTQASISVQTQPLAHLSSRRESIQHQTALFLGFDDQAQRIRAGVLC